MITATLLEAAKENPNMIVSITIGELIEANEALIEKTKSELGDIVMQQQSETYPTEETVRKMLDVSHSTLWRWAKEGYLVPLNIGGKRRYKMSEINQILKGEK